MITVKELIEQLKTCDPDAYVAAYSEYEGCDMIIRKVIPEIKPEGSSIHNMDAYSCRGDSFVAWHLQNNPDDKFILLKEF